MFLIVGLGNPDKQYKLSRHNIGFMVIDEIAEQLGAKVNKKRFKSLYIETVLQDIKLILLKPQTYMNNSGFAISEAIKYFKISSNRVIVVHDEIDFPIGTVKIKARGGSAGHKGIESIIKCLTQGNFIRVRVGIGRPIDKSKVINHVLTIFKKQEQNIIEDSVNKAAKAVKAIVIDGLQKAMNEFNQKPNSFAIIG